jgi:menaquinone-dependent protoporphyrinogen oxidase
MRHIAIVYGTTEGQTAKIAQHMAQAVRDAGHGVTLVHAGDLPSSFQLEQHEAAIVAASVHEGRHQRYVRTWTSNHVDWLNAHPTAFVSVSLTSADPGADAEQLAQGLVDDFCRETGFTPRSVLKAAGALRYTQYNWLKRMLMKRISESHGGATDTHQDHEYTDWDQVRQFAQRFAEEQAGIS